MKTTNIEQAPDLVFALREDIGNPALFAGRAAELSYFLDWAEQAKRELSMSHAIMARRRRGKTALVQRLYNILYTRNDPQLIPFYIRIEDAPISQLLLADTFYRKLLSQYLGFKLRRPELVRTDQEYGELRTLVADDEVLARDVRVMEEMVAGKEAQLAWIHAREAGHRISSNKEERILQFIDEFQFLNEYVYTDETYERRIELGGAYQGTGASKVSPQLITGSYVGWLTTIVRRMVNRFAVYHLEPLPPDEALALVYNYSSIYRIPVTDDSAAYMAQVCENDPFYISALFRAQRPGRDLRSRDQVRETLIFEISDRGGKIRDMWQEYTWYAFDRLNDRNAKKIVLYLARHGNEERTRKQILEDLALDITDRDLEVLLHKLYRVDMIGEGRSNFRYRGLGDPVFEMVFRHIHQEEIETIDLKTIERDIQRQLEQARGKVSYYKGLAAEYRLINHLLTAMVKGIPLDRLVRHVPNIVGMQRAASPQFGPFTSMRKKTFHLDQERSLQVDVYCQAEDAAHADLVIEVKDWTQPVRQAEVEKFARVREQLEPHLPRPAAFLFHAERGLTEAQEAYLAEHGIMCSDGASLTAWAETAKEGVEIGAFSG